MTGRREKVKSKPGLRQAYRFSIFLLGLMFIGIGIGLVVLPGPLTIPPILLGLWIWSTEFRWAERLFDSWEAKGREAWAHAKDKPKRAAAVTGSGLIFAGITFWAVNKYDLVSKVTDAIA